MYKKQIVVIVIVVAIVGYLYSLPVKGLIKPKEAQGHINKAAPTTRPVANVTVDMVSSAAKIAIGPALSAQINDTENQLKKASDDAAKLSLQKNLLKNGMMLTSPRRQLFITRLLRVKKIQLQIG